MTEIITGEKIKAIRHKAGLTQIKFACEVGISQSNLSHVENGDYNLSKAALMRIELKFNNEFKEVING